jgi:hypothetical protein
LRPAHFWLTYLVDFGLEPLRLQVHRSDIRVIAVALGRADHEYDPIYRDTGAAWAMGRELDRISLGAMRQTAICTHDVSSPILMTVVTSPQTIKVVIWRTVFANMLVIVVFCRLMSFDFWVTVLCMRTSL